MRLAPFASKEEGVSFLFENRHLFREHQDILFIMAGKAAVLEKFGALFREPDRINRVNFAEFLSFKVNHHWTGLDRQLPNLVKDIPTLRATVKLITDESQPLGERLNSAIDGLKGMGIGIATPILFVTYPEKYGVLNAKTEAGLKLLGAWPSKSATDGELYERVNPILTWFRDEFNRKLGQNGVDFWALDAYWHALSLFNRDKLLDKLVKGWRLETV